MTFTQRMTLHLNGGGFSVLSFEILADGRPTGITRTSRMNGRPQYLIEVDEFRCGDDFYDVLAMGKRGLKDWLEHHAAAPAVTTDN